MYTKCFFIFRNKRDEVYIGQFYTFCNRKNIFREDFEEKFILNVVLE